MLFCRFLLIALAASINIAVAQTIPIPLPVTEVPPRDLVIASFASPFGQVLTAELAKVLADSGYLACRRDKNLDGSLLEDRSRALLVRHGTRVLERMAATIDQAVFKEKFIARAGPNAAAEMKRLRADKQVQRYLTLAWPIHLSSVANLVTEILDRVNVIKRLGLKGSVSPASSAKQHLLDSDPGELALAGADAFVASAKSPQLQRYVELEEALQAAFVEAFNKEQFLALKLVDLLDGIERDLADLCGP
jgi:hypothetical protein